MEIIKKTCATNTTAAMNRPLTYIVIHYTAGTRSVKGIAAGEAYEFSLPEKKASADFIVDDEQIVQYNPDIKNRYCWSVGGSKAKYECGNGGGTLYKTAIGKNCISIEICSTNSAGKITAANDQYYSFTDKVVKNAVELTKYLMKTYGIDTDHVIRHFDVNCKPCPGVRGWGTDGKDAPAWRAFKAELMNGETVTTAPTATTATTATETKAKETTTSGGFDMACLNTLKKGNKGTQVKALQVLLVGYGYSCGSYGADGSFGSCTHNAVLAFQEAKKLTKDGIVGPKTWAALLGA